MEDTPGATFIGIGIGGIIIAVVFIVLAIIMGIVIGVSTDGAAVQQAETSVPLDAEVEAANVEGTEAESEVEEATAEVTEAAGVDAAVSVTPSPTKENFDN